MQFQVHIQDKSGRPVTDARVTADLAMPAMDMGRNEVSLHPVGAGVYAGTGRFTMAGQWQVTINAVRGRAATQTYFPVDAQ